jgi:hypothetical protein
MLSQTTTKAMIHGKPPHGAAGVAVDHFPDAAQRKIKIKIEPEGTVCG